MLNKHNPRISIITPSFNQAAFLEETIKSVLEQDYSNLEFIVIDGGSTDGSVEIIQKYSSQLAYWVSEPDRGQADALQKGFERSTGDILAYLNSDDLYQPQALHNISKLFAQDPSIGVVYGSSIIIDAAGNPVRMKLGKPGDFIQYFAQLINPIPQSSTFFRREAYQSAGGINPVYQMIMDYDLWARIWFTGGIFRPTDLSLSKFRIHLESKTYLSAIQFAEECMMMVKSYLAHPHIGPKIQPIKNQLYASAHLRFSNAYLISGKKRLARTHYRKIMYFFPKLLVSRRGLNLTIRILLGTPALRGRLADRATRDFY